MRDGSAIARSVRRLQLGRMLSGDQFWSFGDQAIVSAGNFLTLLLVARWTAASEVGLFAIAISLITIAMALQDALVTRPYSIQFHKALCARTEHAFGVLSMAVGVGIAATLLLLGAAAALVLSGTLPGFAALTALIGVILPMILLREFARRFAYANLQTFSAFVLDAIAVGAAIAAIVALGLLGKLSAASALVAVGSSYAMASTAWLFARRKMFEFRRETTWQTWRECWRLGRWLAPGQVALYAQGYVTHWMSAFIAGAAAAGIYAASLSIIALSNPFLLGIFNLMTPKIAHAIKHEGREGIVRHLVTDTLLLGIVMGLFTLAIVFAGDSIMRLLYPGDEYLASSGILSVLALSSLAATLGAPATVVLSCWERGREVAGVALGTLALSLGLVWPMMTMWGLIGAAYALLIVETFGCMVRWALFAVHFNAQTGPSQPEGGLSREPVR